jgi:coiled-coil domain-containing protein 130
MTNAKKHMDDVQIPRIESLQNVSEHYNSDPYSLSSKVRRKFREEKKIELKMQQSDDLLKGRYGLPTTLSLVEDGPVAIQEAKAQWEIGKQELQLRESKRRKTVTETGLISSAKKPNSSKPSPLNSLRTRLLQNTAKRASTTMPRRSIK